MKRARLSSDAKAILREMRRHDRDLEDSLKQMLNVFMSAEMSFSNLVTRLEIHGVIAPRIVPPPMPSDATGATL